MRQLQPFNSFHIRLCGHSTLRDLLALGPREPFCQRLFKPYVLLCHRPVDTAGIAKAYLKRPSTEEPFVRIGEKQCEVIEGLEVWFVHFWASWLTFLALRLVAELVRGSRDYVCPFS